MCKLAKSKYFKKDFRRSCVEKSKEAHINTLHENQYANSTAKFIKWKNLTFRALAFMVEEIVSKRVT